MAEDPIPADVREFILRSIYSIAYLEALLLLRAHREAAWSASSVAARLYISESEAEGILGRLWREGFVTTEGGRFRYDCAPAVDSVVSKLADLYSRQLIPVTNLIHSGSGRIRAFAGAFKLRKDT